MSVGLVRRNETVVLDLPWPENRLTVGCENDRSTKTMVCNVAQETLNVSTEVRGLT